MPERSRPSTVALVVEQVRYQNRLFRRNPMAASFTLAFPMIFLVLFGALFDEIDVAPGVWVEAAQFYAPGLAVFAAVSATYSNIGISTAMTRDEGILKRTRGTPLPPWIYLAGVVGSGVTVAVLGTVAMLLIGALAYGIEMDAADLPAAVVTFVVGVAVFALLGLALAAVCPSGQSAPALAQVTLIPIAFVSNVFVSVRSDPPAWIDLLGDVFPLKAFADAFFAAFDPFRDGSAFEPWLLARMGLWGVVGAVVAVRRFTWEPSAGAAPGSGRRGRRG